MIAIIITITVSTVLTLLFGIFNDPKYSNKKRIGVSELNETNTFPNSYLPRDRYSPSQKSSNDVDRRKKKDL